MKKIIIGGITAAALVIGITAAASGNDTPTAAPIDTAAVEAAAVKVHADNVATWDANREKANAELAAGVAAIEAQKAADAEAARVAAEQAAAQKAADDAAAAAEAAKPKQTTAPAPKQTTAPKATTPAPAPAAPSGATRCADVGTVKGGYPASQYPGIRDGDGDGRVCEK